MPATQTTAAHPELPDLHTDEGEVLGDLAGMVEQLQHTSIAPGRRMIALIRVSKTGDREGEGFIAPEDQLATIRAYCKAHGYEIIDVRHEMDTSGGKVDREVLNGVMADVLDHGAADGVIVAYVSRYARTTAGLQMVRKLQGAKKTFISVKEGIGPEMLATSFGWFTFTIMLAVAELQLAMLTEGFLTARKMHIAAGIANQTPYGYRKRKVDEEDKPRRLEPDPKTSKYVTYMFERRAAGDSWITIANALDKKGAPVPGGGNVWLYTRVRHIVQNRVYLGELSSGEFVNEKAHFPLVTLEQFDAANALNQTPARNGKAAYPLTGIVRCATCGGRMVGFMQTVKAGRKRDGEPRKYPYYRCRRNYSWGKCPAPASCPAGELEQLVAEEFFRRFTRELTAVRRGDDRSADLAAAQTAIDEARSAVALFHASPASKRTAKLLGAEWHEEQVERLNDELEAAQDVWQEIRNAMAGMELPPELEARWWDLSCDEQRGFLSRAFGVVAVKPSGGRGRHVPVAGRARIWIKDETGSPEATLPRRGATIDDKITAMVPIEF